MGWCALLAAILAAAPPSADPEAAALRASLATSQRAALEPALGGLPRYRLDLELDPDASSLKGREQIAVVGREGAPDLWLRIPANASYLDRGTGHAVSVVRVAVNGHEAELAPEDNNMYRLGLASVAAGASALVEIDFVVAVPELKPTAGDSTAALMAQAMALVGGSGDEARTDYGALGRFGRTFNLAGFAPEIARREAGVFDPSGEAGIGEPRWGALGNWVVSLVAPAKFMIAGTGVEMGQTPEPDGRTRTTRVAAAVRGFALVAAEGFAEQKQQAGEVLVRVIGPEAHALQDKKMLDTAARALRFFSERAGAYPWAELDIADSQLSGSMEMVSFPTLLVASQLLSEPSRMLGGTQSPVVDGVLEMAVAHHVAHQWWKGVVGSDGRGRPVLDEPLASYAAILYVEQRRGAEAAQKLMDEQFKRAYRLRRTLGAGDDSVDRPINEYRTRLEIEALLRGKGGLYFARLRKLLGDKAFFAALKQSAVANRFKDVDTDPMLLAAAGVAPGQAEAALKLYDRFMRQKKGDEDLGTELDAGSLSMPGMQIDPASAQILQQFLRSLSGGPTQNPPAPPPPPTTHP